MTTSPIRLAAFSLLNFAFAMGLWLAYTCSWKTWELVFGAGAALLATVGVAVVEGQRFARFAPEPKWLLYFLLEPWYVAADTWTILVVLVKGILGRPSEARLRAIPFDAGALDSAEDAARRALVTALTTIPPNTVVIGIDTHKDILLIHELAPAGTPWVARQLGAKE